MRSFDFFPLSQGGGYQPSRQLPGAIHKRSAVDVRTKEVVRKAYGAGSPVRTAWSSAQEILRSKSGDLDSSATLISQNHKGRQAPCPNVWMQRSLR